MRDIDPAHFEFRGGVPREAPWLPGRRPTTGWQWERSGRSRTRNHRRRARKPRRAVHPITYSLVDDRGALGAPSARTLPGVSAASN